MKTKYNICDNLMVDVDYDYDPQAYSNGDPTVIHAVKINDVSVGDNDLMGILNNETLLNIEEHCLEHYCHYMTD